MTHLRGVYTNLIGNFIRTKPVSSAARTSGHWPEPSKYYMNTAIAKIRTTTIITAVLKAIGIENSVSDIFTVSFVKF